MKIKTTRKAILNSSANLKCAGYCELQTLLRNHSPIAYNSGKYGWNFDVYHVYGVTICTGYRGMPGGKLDRAKDFEASAKAIVYDSTLPYDVVEAKIEKLLQDFCKINGGD